MIYYAGVGSRKAPQSALDRIEQIATDLHAVGWSVRTGDANGPDKWFAHYGKAANHDVLTAHDALDNPEWFDIAARYHPAWDNLSSFVKRLMARNVAVVLGRDLQSPVALVICWTPQGRMIGGTGHTIRVALAHGIPVHNLGVSE